MSGVLIDAVTRIGSSGDPVRPVGTVDPMRAATAEAVAARISRMRCSTLLWTGGADGAASLLARVAATPALVVTSRLKTDDGLALAGEGGPVSTVCVCADVTLTSSPQLQRFVHDVQASSGSAPGPFGLEAYDAGRLLLEQLRLANGSRAGLVERLATLEDFTGLGGRYLPVSGAASTFVAAPPGIWHAAGSRWLPDAPPPS